MWVPRYVAADPDAKGIQYSGQLRHREPSSSRRRLCDRSLHLSWIFKSMEIKLDLPSPTAIGREEKDCSDGGSQTTTENSDDNFEGWSEDPSPCYSLFEPVKLGSALEAIKYDTETHGFNLKSVSDKLRQSSSSTFVHLSFLTVSIRPRFPS